MAATMSRVPLMAGKQILRTTSRLPWKHHCQFYSNFRPVIPPSAIPAQTRPWVVRSQCGYSTSADVSSSAESQSNKASLRAPDNLDEKERHIFDKLASSLEPSRLEVRDVSGGCGSMYAIEIASNKFRGLPMIRQHRLVQGVLEEEIKGWHGIQLKTKLE